MVQVIELGSRHGGSEQGEKTGVCFYTLRVLSLRIPVSHNWISSESWVVCLSDSSEELTPNFEGEVETGMSKACGRDAFRKDTLKRCPHRQ